MLTDALGHAERRQLVGRNAGRLSILPACEPTPEGRSLTAEEAAGDCQRLSVIAALRGVGSLSSSL